MDNGIIIFPTDTVYAIACRPEKELLDKIFSLKKRNKDKKISILVSSKEKAKSLIKKNDFVYALIDKFFPGEITLIYQASEEIKKLISYDTVGIRMPNYKKAIKILNENGGILMATSVNISGKAPACKLEDIDDIFIKAADKIYKSNEKLSNRSSSVFQIFENGDIICHRKGNVELEELINFRREFFEK